MSADEEDDPPHEEERKSVAEPGLSPASDQPQRRGPLDDVWESLSG
jgi:hypothetical protein